MLCRVRNVIFFTARLFFFIGVAFDAYCSPLSPSSFLVINDVHLNALSKHRMVFNPNFVSKDDDLDEPTFKKLLTTIRHNMREGKLARPKFVLFLGDSVGHNRYPNSVRTDETAFFRLFNQYFPQTPLLFVFGNNDSFLDNYGPYRTNGVHGSQSPGEIALASGWKNYFLSTGQKCARNNKIYPCLLNENTQDGYYSVYLQPKFRLITLNTVMYTPRQVGTSRREGQLQMDWLAAQLNDAQRHGDSVLLAMHVLPGRNMLDNSSFWSPDEQPRFLKLVNDYQSTIIGILAAHTHYDEMHIIQNKAGQNQVNAYISPALSTFHGNAPAIRIYDYSDAGNRWQLTDYHTYYFEKNAGEITLKKLYSFREYYCKNTDDSLLQCGKNVTFEKMKKYLGAGNPQFPPTFKFPHNMILQ